MHHSSRKKREGIVLSKKMNKTAIVCIERIILHPLYKKSMKKFKKYKVHDEKNILKANDRVVISETRPISKNKRWRLEKVLS